MLFGIVSWLYNGRSNSIHIGAAFIPLRKPDKLPGEIKVYTLEYGQLRCIFPMHSTIIKFINDDFLQLEVLHLQQSI